MLFRTRDLLVRQRTQTINALRGHFAEFGVIAPRGPAHVERLAEAVEDADSGLPNPVRELGALLLVQVADLDEKIAELEKELRERALEDEQTKRLMSVPGIGTVCAMAIQAFAPPPESFRCGRDFAAWLGLVPRHSSTGGSQSSAGSPRWVSVTSGGVDHRRDGDVRWAVRRGVTKDLGGTPSLGATFTMAGCSRTREARQNRHVRVHASTTSRPSAATSAVTPSPKSKRSGRPWRRARCAKSRM